MHEITEQGIRAAITLDGKLWAETRQEGLCQQTTFHVCWEPAQVGSSREHTLTLTWSRPIVGFQYQWYSECGANRALVPDWLPPVSSGIAWGMPLHCFYDDSGVNHYTVALDDCVTSIQRLFGVHEEDGTLTCRITIPLTCTPVTSSYTVTLRQDETPCRCEDAIRAACVWWEQKYPPMPVPGVARLPMYSTWYSLHQGVYAEEVLNQCKRAKTLGMDTVIIDDGWETDDTNRGFGFCGDWKVAASKIPDMIRLTTQIHQLGMKVMLWFSTAYLGVFSEQYAVLKDKVLNPDSPQLNAYVLDPRYPEVRTFLISTLTNALHSWHLDGLKLDFIDEFHMRPDTPVYTQGMDIPLLEQAVHTLMIDIMKALRSIRPDVLIEFRQRYIGPCMREYGNMFRVSDCPNMTITNRVGTVDLRLTSGSTAVHTDMLMWHPEDSVENAVCQLLNGIFATEQISVRLERMNARQLRALTFWLDFMRREKELLLEAPLYADAPQLLYPLVRTKKEGRAVIAVYAQAHVVTLDDDCREVFLLNANRGTSLALRGTSSLVWQADICDCTGDLQQTLRLTTTKDLLSLDVPPCGMVHLTRTSS